MRTTLKIDDDLYQAAKCIADIEHKTVGQVVSALLRKALLSREYRENVGDIPAFRVSKDAPPITPKMIREADEDAE